jgi:hypothetical protein
MSHQSDHEKYPCAIDDMFVQSLRFSDGQAGGPDPVGIVETIHIPFLLILNTTDFVLTHVPRGFRQTRSTERFECHGISLGPKAGLEPVATQTASDSYPSHKLGVRQTGHIKLSILFHSYDGASTDS